MDSAFVSLHLIIKENRLLFLETQIEQKEVKKMEPLDFASVMTVLRRNINEGLCPTSWI